MSAWHSGEGAWSMSPSTDSRTRCQPVQMMLQPTRKAMIGSRRSQPVSTTSKTPTTTPTEVQTSVSRCLPSAVRVIELCLRPARMRTNATTPLSADAATEIPRPIPTFSSGSGAKNRCTDDQRMKMAATKIITPSTAAEKYSALE